MIRGASNDKKWSHNALQAEMATLTFYLCKSFVLMSYWFHICHGASLGQ